MYIKFIGMEIKKEEYKFNCDKCNYKCKYESHWKNHLNTELHLTGQRKTRSDVKEPYKCEKCDYKTKNITTLKQHKLNEHSTREEREKEFKYFCSYCNFGTFSVDLFNKHNLTKKHKNFVLQIKK
jgi:hypothetical protein